MSGRYEIEVISVDGRNIITTDEMRKLNETYKINDYICERLNSIQYDTDEHDAKIKQIIPLYDNDNDLSQLMLVYERQKYIEVILDNDEDVTYYYPLEYKDFLKEGSTITIRDKNISIKSISYEIVDEFLVKAYIETNNN